MTKNEKAADVDVLGTPYAVLFQTKDANAKLKEADGLCEIYAHKIIVDPSVEEDSWENVAEHFRKVLRHEAFHAFFAEAGLNGYLRDEVLVDFLAAQYGKIRKLMDAMNSVPLPEEVLNAG